MYFHCKMSGVTTLSHNVTVLRCHLNTKSISIYYVPVSESVLASGHTASLHCHFCTISHGHQGTSSGKHHGLVNDISGRRSVSWHFTLCITMYVVHLSTSSPKHQCTSPDNHKCPVNDISDCHSVYGYCTVYILYNPCLMSICQTQIYTLDFIKYPHCRRQVVQPYLTRSSVCHSSYIQSH